MPIIADTKLLLSLKYEIAYLQNCNAQIHIENTIIEWEILSISFPCSTKENNTAKITNAILGATTVIIDTIFTIFFDLFPTTFFFSYIAQIAK